MGLKEEIFEQPEVIRRLIDTQWARISDVAAEIRARMASETRTDSQSRIDYVFLTARGTSDHAGLYAKYLWAAFNRLPIALAAPSLFSIYRRPPQLRNSLVVGISQSGESPDILSVMAEGRRQGVPTLAITNTPSSPLAEVSDWVIDIAAGPEYAVAATKTYTAQLAVIALLSIALDDEEGRRFAEIQRVPALMSRVLEADGEIKHLAERYRYMNQCVVLGRGYNYATAYEWALKLKELTYSVAAPYSSADFQHGPVAMVGQGFPVLAVVPRGAVFDHMVGLLEELKCVHQVELLVLSNHEEALAIADRSVALPDELPEWLSPLVAIVPAQLFCYHLTRAKGFDTESPRMLSKVTKTE